MREQKWFEMRDIRRRTLDTAVWIPLRASQTISDKGKLGWFGHEAEFFGAGSIAIKASDVDKAKDVGWAEIGLTRTHRSSVEQDQYVPADVVRCYRADIEGNALVLAQDGNSDDPQEWHLHHDLVIALGLKREGDKWLAMDEGYLDVARLTRANGKPALLEIRSEHLRDYLCARGMALRVSSYRDRQETVNDASSITWTGHPTREVDERDRWEGRVTDIVEGGFGFGQTAAVLELTRKDVDFEEDVPRIGPSDQNITSRSWTIRREGKKVFRIQGELWRDEWVWPADLSVRVRGDKAPSSVFFITDARGTRTAAENLDGQGGWLWFRPEVIECLRDKRGGALHWYTRDTGGVKCAPGSFTAFGVNKLGFVNVYATDLAFRPHWEQKVWVGFNTGPEGGVSEELLAAQAEGRPANTRAPEELLPEMLFKLNEIARASLSMRIFREHEEVRRLIVRVHRFRATDNIGLLSLAKDLARITADDIDVSSIHRLVPPPHGLKWGSLKSLENAVALSVGAEKAHKMIGPLFGIYELRHADAHLPSSDLDKSFALAGVDRRSPWVFQGLQMLDACVSSLEEVSRALAQSEAKSWTNAEATTVRGKA